MMTASDVRLVHSRFRDNTSQGGGEPGNAPVVHGARDGLLPPLTQAARQFGAIYRRKCFVLNEHAAGEVAYTALAYLLAPSPAEDRVALAHGTLTDRQEAVAGEDVAWMGTGRLATSLAGGEMVVVLDMGGEDFHFLPGGFLRLSGHYLAGQSAAAGVAPGHSVILEDGIWKRIAPTAGITHPEGIWCGAGLVHTMQAGTHSEVRRLEDPLREAEQVGLGTGGGAPALSALARAGRGVVAWAGMAPVVSAVCGGVPRTVTIGPDGQAAGYCSGGQLDLATGQWITPIVWTTAPDLDAPITITYREHPFARVGNQYTVTLAEAVQNPYATATTLVAGCLYQAQLAPSVDGHVVVSGGGSLDHAGYPVTAPNFGSVEDTWTLTFTGAAAFTCSGATAGAVGTGTLGADFAPVNPATGTPYFTLPAAAWGGSWQAGDTVTFVTHPGALPVWVRQVVPAGMADAAPLTYLGWQVE